MPRLVSMAASDVPKKALAYCLLMITSSGVGGSWGTMSASGSPSTMRRSRGTFCTKMPPSRPLRL